MEEIEVDGKKIEIKEDSEIGTTQRILMTKKFVVKYPYGSDEIFKAGLNKQNKDGTFKYDIKHRNIMMQDFILAKMRKIKDELLDREDFWDSFEAFRKLIFEKEHTKESSPLPEKIKSVDMGLEEDLL